MRLSRAAIHSISWALLASCAAAFIVPEELVSFLSIVYSNIPPIRKGTDSRLGLGFRLGPHADAQIILELGPQTNTRAIGAAGPSFNVPTSSKRHTYLDQPLDQPLDQHPPALNPAAGNWLTAWRTSVQASRRPAQVAVDDDNNNLVNQADLSAPGPITVADPTKLSGAPLVSHLRQLYRKEPEHQSEPQPKRQPPSQPPPKRQPPSQPQPKRQPPSQPQPKRQPSQPWPLVVTGGSKPTKRSKSKSKTTTTSTTTAATPIRDQDLSDVSLD